MRRRAWMFCRARFSGPLPPSACASTSHAASALGCPAFMTGPHAMQGLLHCLHGAVLQARGVHSSPAARQAHPEAGREAGDGGKQRGHGLDNAVDLDVQVVRPDLAGQAPGALLRLGAAVHRAHVHAGQ